MAVSWNFSDVAWPQAGRTRRLTTLLLEPDVKALFWVATNAGTYACSFVLMELSIGDATIVAV